MTQIIVDRSGTEVRLSFRVYFFVLSILIPVLGQLCVTSRAKLKLLKGERVQLHLMSNWLSHFDPLMMAKKFRALPGGWLWFGMLLAFLLISASDFVTTLVQQLSVQDRCIFGTGMVVKSNPPLEAPPFNGKPYAVATQAQLISLANGGLQGVYDKVNTNLNFSADDSDVLGHWNCVMNSTILQYPATATVDDIIANLQQQQLLYANSGNPIVAVSQLEGGFSHLVIWDTSAGNTESTQFDVQVSVDTTALGTDPKIMQSYECKLVDTSGQLASIQASIPSYTALYQGLPFVQGAIYNGWRTPASNNTGAILEQVLNAMTMVAGGQNYLLDDSAAGLTQGCLTRRTEVPWVVVALAVAVALLTIFLLLFWILSRKRFQSLAREMQEADGGLAEMQVNFITNHTPGNIAEWMAQAVEEYRGQSRRRNEVDDDYDDGGLVRADEVVKARDVRKWLFGKRGSTYGIVGRVDAAGFGDTVPLMDVGSRGGVAHSDVDAQNVRGKVTS